MNGRPVKLGEQVANSITLPTCRPRISCNGRGSMTATRPKRVSNPAVRRSTMALTENSFAGIVGGVSGVRSEQILGGFSGRGVPPCHRRPGR